MQYKQIFVRIYIIIIISGAFPMQVGYIGLLFVLDGGGCFKNIFFLYGNGALGKIKKYDNAANSTNFKQMRYG